MDEAEIAVNESMRCGQGEKLIVVLTKDQLRAIIGAVDEASFKGRDAAFVVSIQQAFTEARSLAGKNSPEKE